VLTKTKSNKKREKRIRREHAEINKNHHVNICSYLKNNLITGSNKLAETSLFYK
jgi:hypothetical protein